MIWSLELAVLLALSSGHLVLNARGFARFGSRVAAQAAQALHKPRHLDEEVDDVRLHVRQRLLQKRQEAWLGLSFLIDHCAGLGVIWASVNVVFFSKSAEFEQYATNHIVFYLLLRVTNSAYRHLPTPNSPVDVQRCDLAYGGFMCYSIWNGMVGGCYDKQLGLIQMAASAVHRSTRQCVVWNVLYTICALSRGAFPPNVALMLGGAEDGLEACWRELSLDLFWDPLFNLSVIIGITMIFEKLTEQEAKSTIVSQFQRNERKALTSILNATSDAVVRLDAELKIVGPTQKLASMLLHPTNTLDGVAFKSVVRPGSTDFRWITDLPEETGDASFATRVQMEMLDSTGSSVKIQGFHTQFKELDGSLGHLLGLSEVGDPMEPRGIPPLASEVYLAAGMSDLAAPPRASDEQESQSLRGCLSSRSSGSSDLGGMRMPLVEGGEENGFPTVWLKVDDGLPMVQCNSGFLAIGGPTLHLGVHLQAWVGRDSDMVRIVQLFVNECLTTVMERSVADVSLEAHHFTHDATVSLSPQHLGINYMLTANVTLIMESLGASDGSGLMRIVFRVTKVKKKKRKGSKRGSSGRGRAAVAEGGRARAATAAVLEGLWRAPSGTSGRAETPPPPRLLERL